VASAGRGLRYCLGGIGLGAAMTVAYDIDLVVIGAGVVGLAVAHACVQQGRSVWVLEQAERAGEGVSSRNSGVIHAGLYYAPGSLKARFCVRGRDLMYEFCARRGVPHQRCGKYVVANQTSELPALEALAQRSAENGVVVHWVSRDEARRHEPELECAAALDSPDSGIVEVPEFVMALIGGIEQGDSRVLCEVRVDAVKREAEGFVIETARGETLRCRQVVNAAGLDATAVAARVDAMQASLIPRMHLAAGHYYSLRGRAPFRKLIYPLPEPSGLGVHLGFDLAGRARFGPDVRWIDAVDYRFDDSQRDAFYAGVRRWWPRLPDDALAPDFVGVRPKLSGHGEGAADFVLQDASVHGVPGMVNLFGIDSPGLTSSLAIGEEVEQRLRDR
jgi:L-2-hydroxyglutarate oxidase LhgO